ncbi:MAG: phospholipase D-like domain-containing protein [Candidatus Omnitrophota bacterium]|nr:phospholipase D-like domain-containing protein [Candidatus Omnitrophota bacterium]
MPNKINKKLIFSIGVISLFLFFFPLLTLAQDQPEFSPAKVKDISDRKYEPAVIELLDNAKESIVVSMYIIQAGANGPVRLLIKDLEEALARGVSVDIYLNTRFQDRRALSVEKDEVFNTIREKGGRIFGVTPSTRMHDKLIIVDSRYVVIGSTNWSVAALKDNYESATLIDSPEHAKDMLVRIRQRTLKGDEPNKPEKERKVKRSVILNEDSIIAFDCDLLTDKTLFPRMVSDSDARAMDTYLLLKAYAYEQEANEYFLSLEQLAVDLGMPADWSDTALRRQAIKVLTKLQDRYKLIGVDFKHGKDAWITFRDLSADVFEFKGKFLNPEYLSRLSQPAKFILLIKALLTKEGTKLDSFTQKELGKRFNIDRNTLGKGIKEISAINAQ